MANILDEQERKRKELAAQGIHTRGVAGAQGGPAQMTYKPIEQRTGAEAKALGVSPQMQTQIAKEQGLFRPAPVPAQANPLPQAPAPQALGMAPQAAGVTPQAQAANQQLETARADMGANRAKSSKRLTDMVAQVDPQIRADANLRREWRMMTPQQRKEHIGLKKLEMDARGAEDAAAGATWEDIDKMSRSFADATGTAMDSYGNSFYTPEQQMFIRKKRRNIDRAASEMFSQADRSAWRTPQDMYQAIASLPEVQQAGPFGQAYAFNIMRRYATPQLRAQMEAEDRNQGLFTEWFNSKTEAEIAEMQQASGMRMTADGSKDYAAELFLNRDKDIGAGSIYQQFLSESPQVFTAIDGRVQVDPAQKGRFEQAQATAQSQAQAESKQAEDQAKTQALTEEAAQREQISGVKHYVLGGKIVPETELKRLGQEPERQQLPRAAADRAYSQARQDAQKYESALQLQQSDPQEYFANAVQSALSVLTPEERNAEIPRLLEIAKTRELTKEDFGEYGNFDAFKEMIDAYNDAISQNPAVLQAQIQRSKEEMERIERDEYGVVQ